MNNSYQSFLIENLRLAILRFLFEDNDYSLNDSVLQSALEQIGFSMSREAIRAEFVLLQELGVIKFETVLKSIYVAHLTERGVDVVKGRITIPGIKRPGPGYGE